MDDINIRLKNKIMRRVYAIWFLRSVYFKIMGFFTLAFATSFYVSFLSVLKNAVSSSYSPGSVFNYMFSSFLAANIASKMLAVVMIIGIFALGWSLFKTFVTKRKANIKIQFVRF